MSICPFCGTIFVPSAAEQGPHPGTMLCPGCDQVLDAPPESEVSLVTDGALPEPPQPPEARQAPETPPSPEASQASQAPQATQAPQGWPEQTSQPGGAQAPQAETPPDADPHVRPPAWEGPGQLMPRLWQTIVQIMLHPGKTLSTPLPAERTTAPLSFGLIMGTVGALLSILWGRMSGDPFWSTDAALWVVPVAPLLVLILMYLSCWTTHFGLWMVGASEGGMDATFRYVGYSQAVNLLALIPAVNTGLGLLYGLLSGVWGLVVAIVGLAAAHRAHKRQVVSAILVVVVIVGGAVGLMVGLVVGVENVQQGGGYIYR